MKRLALAAAGAAVIGLTSCSGSATPSAGPAAHRTPISCSQQYRSWTYADGNDVMGALHGVSSAANSGNDKVMRAALKQAKPAVAKAAQHPIPSCADPRGYWSVLLMHVNAAAAGKGSSSSARAALHDVPRIHRQLLAEVKETAR